MHLFDRLDAARERRNVLRHPFYRRWSDGVLVREELAFYAGEYRHAVVALANQAEAAAEAAEGSLMGELGQHAAEEAAHVDLWDDFALALGAETDRPPLPETTLCAEAWTAGDELLERLCILYVVEEGQPVIAQTKLDGLAAHYGLGGDVAATAYFALHVHRDREHAAHSRRVLEERLAGADADRLVELADAALEGNWRLLDGVEQHEAPPSR